MSPNDRDHLEQALSDAVGHDNDRVPTDAGIETIRNLALGHARIDRAETATPISAAPSRSRTSRRALVFGAVAAGTGLVVGSAATIGLTGTDDTNSDTTGFDPSAIEEIAFVPTGSGPSGTISRSALIDHSWGGELMLDIADLPAGNRYDVVYIDLDGATLAAGSFQSVPDVLMKCRFNAALLREDTARIDITTSNGDIIASANLN
ncbi:hypothetical protein [Ilumatobacter sp.]|uniref:hypothetical protein n=1 Tax=Ilumatobacter sp. TaxID=1967498 RepID=UPI003C5B2C5C